MSLFAIRTTNLSKVYRIGAPQERYPTIRESMARAAGRPLQAVRALMNGQSRQRSRRTESFTALKDVSFSIAPGEVVGVVGRNGAGKSTLLKILSRITEPSSGVAEIRGRVGSLLEVGTGFHQELTGRENIYLNGAILGMKRAETDRKFDEIVEFAEVGPFIDTPVKHYSSGMHLRLAFSVAAHLEPEILLVDEVLAVGDLAFQRKCLGKMEHVAAHGRTVLFVSHNLGVVKELCHTSIVLDHGQLTFRGPVVAGLAHYSQSLLEPSASAASESTRWFGLAINGRPGGVDATVANHQPMHVDAFLDLREDVDTGRLIFLMHDAFGNLVVHRRVYTRELGARGISQGRYRVSLTCPPLWLAPGVYTVFFKFFGTHRSGEEIRHVSERAIVDVAGDSDGIGQASLAPNLAWSMEPESAAIFAER
jgi:lipopolysaccharide transport system ATP-binding protein